VTFERRPDLADGAPFFCLHPVVDLDANLSPLLQEDQQTADLFDCPRRRMFDLLSTPASTADATLSAPFAEAHSLLGVASSNSVNGVNASTALAQSPRRECPVALPPIDDAEAVAGVFGMASTSSACPLPGHNGSASIDLVQRRGCDELRLVCVGCDADDAREIWALEHDGPARAAHWLNSVFDRSLADAYWAIRLDRTLRHGQRLSRGRRWLWRLLLAHELGLVTPHPVDLAPLAPDAPEDVVRVAALFALHRGLRLAVGDDAPMPFTERFVAELLFEGNRDAAGKAIKALLAAGVIVKAGEEPPLGRRAHGSFLYRPGRP
jgi:hypothetical protein